MTERTYNGWTNYETWNVALWLGNDQGSQEYWSDAAQTCWNEADGEDSDSTFTRAEQAALDLAELLKSEVTDAAPDLGSSTYADLLGAALSEVKWLEIAEHYVADCDQSEPDEDEGSDRVPGDSK